MYQAKKEEEMGADHENLEKQAFTCDRQSEKWDSVVIQMAVISEKVFHNSVHIGVNNVATTWLQ